MALARELVNEPSLLLLDEPLGALDLKLRRAMQLELKALQKRLEMTFLYVTHDQEEALTMSDRVGVMADGRLVQVGTPEEIYDRPATRYVADFVGEANMLEGRVVERADGRVTLDVGDEPVTAHTGTSLAESARACLILRPERIDIERWVDRLEPAPDGRSVLGGTVQEAFSSERTVSSSSTSPTETVSSSPPPTAPEGSRSPSATASAFRGRRRTAG